MRLAIRRVGQAAGKAPSRLPIAIPVRWPVTDGATPDGGTYKLGRRPMKLVPVMVKTSSSRWLDVSARQRTSPISGRLLEGRVSRTTARLVRVSPGRTGAGQRRSSTPGEPMLTVLETIASTQRRITMAAVCQPLATRPPKIDSLARAGSDRKYCGSYCRAKALVGSSVTGGGG